MALVEQRERAHDPVDDLDERGSTRARW